MLKPMEHSRFLEKIDTQKSLVKSASSIKASSVRKLNSDIGLMNQGEFSPDKEKKSNLEGSDRKIKIMQRYKKLV